MPRCFRFAKALEIAMLASILTLQTANAHEPNTFNDLPQAVGDDWMSMHEWSFCPHTTAFNYGINKLDYAQVGAAPKGLLLYGSEQTWGFWDWGYLEWMRSDFGDISEVIALPDQRTLLVVRVWGEPIQTHVMVINAEGAELQRMFLSEPCEVVYRSGMIYAFSKSGKLVALNLEGDELWQVNTGCTFVEDGREHIAISDGLLVIVGKANVMSKLENVVIAYSLAGQELWRQPTRSDLDPGILLVAENIYIDHNRYNSYIGRKLDVGWQIKYPYNTLRIFTSPAANSLRVFDTGGQSLWELNIDIGNYYETGSLENGGLMLLPRAYMDYVGSWFAGTAFAYNGSGERVWEVQLPTAGRGASLAKQCVDGRLYVISNSLVGLSDREAKPFQAQLHRLSQTGNWEDLYTFPIGYTPKAIATREDDYPGTAQLAVMLEEESNAKPKTYGVVTFEVWDAKLRQQPQG